MGQYYFARWRLTRCDIAFAVRYCPVLSWHLSWKTKTSVVVVRRLLCYRRAGGSAAGRVGGRARPRPTLHGGPVQSCYVPAVRAIPCYWPAFGQNCFARCRLSASSVVVCNARGRSAAAGPGRARTWPVRRPILQGGTVWLRPVSATPNCLVSSLQPFWSVKMVIWFWSAGKGLHGSTARDEDQDLIKRQGKYRVGQKSDTSRTIEYNVREVSLFWLTLYIDTAVG